MTAPVRSAGDIRTNSPEETAQTLERYDNAMAGVLPGYFPIVAERGEGSWLTDIEGRRYLDFGSGIGVTNVGHCHPLVVSAIERQARTLIHTSVVTRHVPAIDLAERLGALAPFLTDPQVFFCNSGAEAVDGALKLARHVSGRGEVVAFRARSTVARSRRPRSRPPRPSTATGTSRCCPVCTTCPTAPFRARSTSSTPCSTRTPPSGV
jgi:4-aminobutyrate aminotransferase-like enzyme